MNFVTCSIGEETGGSIVKPSSFNDVVGVVPTRELVSASGMIQRGLNTRVGPICRTVTDAARILQVYKGFDPEDELTSFGDGRVPDTYDTTTRTSLAGLRIGVIREYMDKALFNVVDTQSIDITDAAIDQLRALGATIVDPGEHGALFQSCVDQYIPKWQNQQFLPGTDQLQRILDMYFDPSTVPHTATGRPSIRSFGGTSTDSGDAKFNFNQYIHDRGDAKIHNLTELIANSQFWNDPNPAMGNRRNGLMNSDRPTTLATASATQTRFAVQTAVFTCFARNDLDAVVFPTGNVPPGVLTSPEEPSLNDRGIVWSGLSAYGFPAMTIPSGFTTQVYDRDANGQLMAAKPAALPVGVQLLALPFNEQKLFTIGAAYEAASKKRIAPPDFPPVPQTAITARAAAVGGSVPATLSLSVGSASFGAFTAGATKDYTASATATVLSTAGDAALSHSDPGHLTNGAFSLPSPLEVTLSKAAWTAPVSNDLVVVGFKQHIAAGDALRTGGYSRTLTFTLSTTAP
jgi:Asp-tRNA(Asn)/Glu-tRNA(Gln) amidotransferase A subunit family amidase